MSKSLVDNIRQTITPSVVAQLSASFGESTQAVERGLSGATVAILGIIATRSNDLRFINQLFLLVKDPSSAALLETPVKMLEHARRAALEPDGRFGRFQSLVLGSKGVSLADGLARLAGVNSSTAVSLLAVAASFIFRQLGRLVRQEHLDAAGLGRRLASERSSIIAALPARLATLTTIGSPFTPVRQPDRFEPRAAILTTPVPRTWSPLAWVVVALLGSVTLAALFDVLGASRLAQESSLNAPIGSVGTTGNGAYITRTLPGRAELRLPAAGMEGRLLTYIQTASPFDRPTWFEFDRVDFEADSATLRPDSREQIENIAAILKAYPNVRVKIGGYTGTWGNPATNLRLSEIRATAVATELRSLGVSNNRLVAEGYGDQHPLTGSIAHGGARGGRVAIRVISSK
jgi:outer membrane protein OmpA-like peptidoglycan-associated protein